MKEVELTQGFVALVDDDLLALIKQHKWSAQKKDKTYYAVRREGKRGEQRGIYMHHVVLPPREGFVVDHIDRNGLNNTRSNLRYCLALDNARNRGKNTNNSSGFIGVAKTKSGKKYRAYIGANYKQIFLGTFETPEDAARCRDKAAKEMYGAFAVLNFQGEI